MASRSKRTNEFFRRDMVSKWKASGLTQAEFCRKHGLDENRLSRWKKSEERDSDAARVVPFAKHRSYP